MSWLFAVISVLLAAPDAPSPECAGCHPAQARAYADSRHRVAWVNPLFQAEYAPHPKKWCVSCHASDVAESERAAPPVKTASRGVSCLGCHADADGSGLVSRAVSPFSIHQTRVVPSFGAPSDCARCHQFNFPRLDHQGGLLGYTDEPMQKTVSEAIEFGGAEARCDSCHDPHRAAGSHDVETVRRAMTVELCRGASGLELSITNSGAGHNLPSGGVHRYISARLWRSSAPAKVKSLRIGREFEADGTRRTTTVDTTIPPRARRTLIARASDLGGGEREPINAEIRYHYAVAAGATLIDGSPAVRSIVRMRNSPELLPMCVE